MHFHDGEFVSATAEIDTSKGGMEHSGLQLRRNSTHPRLYSEETVVDFGRAAAARTLKTIDALRIPYKRVS